MGMDGRYIGHATAPGVPRIAQEFIDFMPNTFFTSNLFRISRPMSKSCESVKYDLVFYTVLAGK